MEKTFLFRKWECGLWEWMGRGKWMLFELEDGRQRIKKPVDSQIYHKELSDPWWVVFNQDDFRPIYYKTFKGKEPACSNKRHHRDTHKRMKNISSEPFLESTSQLVFPFELCCLCSFFFFSFSAMFSHILFALAVHNFPLHTNVHLTTTKNERLHLLIAVKSTPYRWI